ncbi:MAG: hypothetical protein H0T88_03130, partial [Lysobacter sp.]|nr:hypothetical protein [Lysobacter sp.]
MRAADFSRVANDERRAQDNDQQAWVDRDFSSFVRGEAFMATFARPDADYGGALINPASNPWTTLAGRLTLAVALGLGLLVACVGAIAFSVLSNSEEREFISRSLATTQAIRGFSDATADHEVLRSTLSGLVSAGHVMDAQLLPVEDRASSAVEMGDGTDGAFRAVTVTIGGDGGLLVLDFDEAPTRARIESIREAVVLGALFFLLAGVTASAWLGGSLGRSLGRITGLARRLARSETTLREAGTSSIAELRELESALYEMHAEVEEARYFIRAERSGRPVIGSLDA